MSGNIVKLESRDITPGADEKQFLSMSINGQLFGFPVQKVQDVLRPQKITKIPLALSEIMGSINLRGRIVTVINVRTRLNLADFQDLSTTMQVVVEHENELYSLVVDSVGEVLNLPLSGFEKTPANLDSAWKDVAQGVYRLEDKILVVLDIANLLRI
jgi:purine-binding chemotaxis protein CheW